MPQLVSDREEDHRLMLLQRDVVDGSVRQRAFAIDAEGLQRRGPNIVAAQAGKIAGEVPGLAMPRTEPVVQDRRFVQEADGLERDMDGILIRYRVYIHRVPTSIHDLDPDLRKFWPILWWQQ
jgi:hypothetical protein